MIPQTGRFQRRNPQARTAGVDPKTGAAKFTIALAEGESLAANKVALRLTADLMICDDKETYCAKIREQALLTLPSGTEPMQPDA